ncbi:MAG: glycosyltransferase, partial [Candidatus Binatia bacterium]
MVDGLPTICEIMNVLIITGIFPPDIGGPATYVPKVATALADRGHEITVVTLSDSSGFRIPDSGLPYSFSVVRIRRGLFKPFRVLLTIVALLRWGRRADVLFVNGLYIEAVLANSVLHKPLVQKIVGDWAWERATNHGWIADTFEAFQSTHYNLQSTRYA